MTFRWLLPGLALIFVAGCDDAPTKKNPFDPPPSDTVKPPPSKPPPKPTGPPPILVGENSVKVRFNEVMVSKPDGKQQLTKAIEEAKEHIDGKEVKVSIDRKATLATVELAMDVLYGNGATKLLITTSTRNEYPGQLEFTPKAKVSSPAKCSVIAKILADYSTAVWNISGGTARKKTKGMAGPDLTTTGDTIERKAAGCKQSKTFFVTAAKEVEWGLAYDLAASTGVLDKEKASFDTVVYLPEVAAGKPVGI